MFSETSVELHLGAHDLLNKPSVLESTGRVDEIISQTSGKVFVLLEGPTTICQATTLERRVKNGILPSLAYIFIDKGFASSRLEELLRELTIKIKTNRHPYDPELMTNVIGDDFRTAELTYLDSLFLKYMNNEGRSRLGVLIEATADEVEIDVELFNNHDARIFQLSMEGYFQDAISLLKKDSQKMASDSLIREDIISNQIIEHIGPGVSAIVARFGSNHTGIYHRLRKLGLNNLSRVFLDQGKENRSYYFEPMSVAIRKIMNRGVGSLSELDWYKALIGHAVLRVLFESLIPEVEDYDELSSLHQGLVLAAHKFSAIIETYKDVEEIREKGIKPIITEIVGAI